MEPELFTPEGERVISTIFEAHEMEELLYQDSEDSFSVFLEKVLKIVKSFSCSSRSLIFKSSFLIQL